MPAVQHGLTKLKFKEKLLQSGRSSGSDALQKRLKTLHEELQTLDQDVVDVRSLQKVAEELVAQQILLHRDTGVKAYTACCLVDILRLFAPDAPYTTFQLDDIFNFILDQIETNLRAPASIFTASSSGGTKSRSGKDKEPTTASRITDIPYYQEYLYTLESLATIKSVVCVGDIDKPEQLVMRHFEVYFKILRPSMNRTILGYLQEILVALVEDQKDHLPEGILELLLAQLKTFKEHTEHSAFIMATGILRSNAEDLQRYLHGYFIDTVIRHGKDPLDEEIVKINDVYSLLVILYCHCPDILSNILPVLEEQVRGDNQFLRELSTTTLGQMFGSIPAASASGSAAALQLASLAGPMRSTWTAWLGRRIDKSVAIRLAWVASARNVLINHEEMRHDLEAALREKLIDPEERVRADVCKLYGKLPYDVALHHVDVQSLKSIAERLQDKKLSVSTEALQALGKLYNAAYVEIEGEEALAMNQFSWIPEAIMHAGYAAGSLQYNQAVRKALSTYLVPLPPRAEDEKAWVDRLIVVAQHMDESAFTALMKHCNLISPGIEPWNMFAAACEANNKESTKEHQVTLMKLSRFLAMTMSDSVAADKALQEFAEAEAPRLYKLLRSLTDISLDLKTLLKAKAEFLKKLEEWNPALVDTLTAMLYQGSMWIGQGPTTAQNILSFIAKHCPGLYSTHVAALQIAVVSKHVSHSEVAMQALASLAKFQPETAIKESRMLDKIASFCVKGSVKQAKFAARILAYSAVQDDRCTEVIANAIAYTNSEDENHLLASLAALGEFARAASADFEVRASEITAAVKDKVLMHCFPEIENDDEVWQPENDLDVWSRAKILALKIGINYCVAQARQPDIVDAARPNMRSLIVIVDREGSIIDETRDSGALRLHLRLKAASGLLKMAQHTKYDRELSNADYETIAMTCQDSEYVVRAAFLSKLSKVLHRFHISPRWYMVPMVSAVDPDETNVQTARTLVRSLAKKMDSKTKIELLDRPFLRFLCFLAHHPDLEAAEAGDVRFLSKYLRFYIETVVNQDNVSLIYHLASRLKTVRDRNRPPTDEKLYVVSEMACLVLNHYAKQHSWQIATYPGKESMPKDIFVPLQPGSDELRQVRTKSYLPDDAKQWLSEPVRKAAAPVRPKVERVSLSPASSTKKRAAKSQGRKPPAKRRKREDSPEELSDESEEESDEDLELPDEVIREATPEAAEGEAVLGRGGTRRAKRIAAKKPQATALSTQ